MNCINKTESDQGERETIFANVCPGFSTEK